MSEWISVKDKKPDCGISVIGVLKDPDGLPPVSECFYISSEFDNPYFPLFGSIQEITHWMPLPEPPKEV